MGSLRNRRQELACLLSGQYDKTWYLGSLQAIVHTPVAITCSTTYPTRALIFTGDVLLLATSGSAYLGLDLGFWLP